MPRILIPLRPILGVLQIGIKSQGYREPDTIMSDSEHSTVTYTSVPEDDSDIDTYLAKEPEKAPPFTYLYHLCSGALCLTGVLPVDDGVISRPCGAANACANSPTHQSPGYIPESDPEEEPEEDDEEDPADYPADRGDDDDDDAEEEEHLAPADPIAVSYSADRGPIPCLSRSLGYRSAGPGYEAGESSAAGAARQFGPTTAEADLYGFANMLDAAPGRRTSRELGYGITDTWDNLVGAIRMLHDMDPELYSSRVNMLYRDRPFHRRTALLIEEEARLSRAAWARSMDACDQVHSEGISLRTTVMAQQSEITELQAADRRRQAVITDLLKADYRRQRQLVETLKDSNEAQA
ncbi:hypothetical protein Tco_0665143 [Tanacetum coccineum]